MGAGELVSQSSAILYRLISRKWCYTRREFYSTILTLFTTFRELPPLPLNGSFSSQEGELAEVAESIGSALRHATSKESSKSIRVFISTADEALSKYLKKYCSVRFQGYRHAMNAAMTNDEKVDKWRQYIENQLNDKLQKLRFKSTHTVDLHVNQWSSESVPHPKLLLMASLKIEDDASLDMLIYRYMDKNLYIRGNEAFDLQWLRLNPQIYRQFPLLKNAISKVKYIPCVNRSITLREYRSESGHNAQMFLIYDRNDTERKAQLTAENKEYTPPMEFTTAWFIEDCNYSAAVVRMNSIDYTLYYWDLKQLATRPDELILSSSSELSYVSPSAPTFPQPRHYQGHHPSQPSNRALQSSNHGISTPSAPPQTTHPSTLPRPTGPAFSQQSPPPPHLAQAVSQPTALSGGSIALPRSSGVSFKAPPAPHQTTHHGISPPPPGPAMPTPSPPPPRSAQPAAAASSTTNVSPPPPSRSSLQGPHSGASAQHAPPRAAVQPQRQQKAAPVAEKKTKGTRSGPDAHRLQNKSPGGPSELIEEDSQRGWFGNFIKSGLQRFGGYGGSSKT